MSHVHIRPIIVAVCVAPHASQRLSAMCASCPLPRSSCSSLFRRSVGFIDLLWCVCSVQDYWEGYKLFCYAYYSHFARHAIEFRESKLGECALCAPLVFHFLALHLACPCTLFPQSDALLLGFYISRPTCVAPASSMPFTLPPFGPHHLHATPPSGGDVLQVGVPGGLQQPSSPPGVIRRCAGAGVSRPGTIPVVNGARR